MLFETDSKRIEALCKLYKDSYFSAVGALSRCGDNSLAEYSLESRVRIETYPVFVGTRIALPFVAPGLRFLNPLLTNRPN